jgi:hypothetical protein
LGGQRTVGPPRAPQPADRGRATRSRAARDADFSPPRPRKYRANWRQLSRENRSESVRQPARGATSGLPHTGLRCRVWHVALYGETPCRGSGHQWPRGAGPADGKRRAIRPAGPRREPAPLSPDLKRGCCIRRPTRDGLSMTTVSESTRARAHAWCMLNVATPSSAWLRVSPTTKHLSSGMARQEGIRNPIAVQKCVRVRGGSPVGTRTQVARGLSDQN